MKRKLRFLLWVLIASFGVSGAPSFAVELPSGSAEEKPSFYGSGELEQRQAQVKNLLEQKNTLPKGPAEPGDEDYFYYQHFSPSRDSRYSITVSENLIYDGMVEVIFQEHRCHPGEACSGSGAYNFRDKYRWSFDMTTGTIYFGHDNSDTDPAIHDSAVYRDIHSAEWKDAYATMRRFIKDAIHFTANFADKKKLKDTLKRMHFAKKKFEQEPVV